MKKKILLLCIVMVLVTFASGCGSKSTAGSGTSGSDTSDRDTSATKSEPLTINVTALKGPTAMGMVKLMDDSAMKMADSSMKYVDDDKYQFDIVGAVDEVTPKIVKGEADIAAVPANLASVLYNNTDGKVKVMAINTLGVLYIVENGDTIKNISDLKGKTIYASGKGATPEYALNYILAENGLNPASDVTIEWKSEHTECLSAIAADEGGIALLPQPFVATAQSKNPNIKVALDLNKEWDAVQKTSSASTASALITGVIVGNSDFIEKNPAAVQTFMAAYKESVAYAEDDIAGAAKLIGIFDICPEEIALKALPECNITFISGKDMKNQLAGYLQVLYDQNPAAVGGTLPDDAFYYLN
ncbi:MAG: ABC transporter substrate-binding protein [Clostridiales Family XIII bacterium]|jgi:NitT/TauT family transport system substrate-binding protein|nr:ABC transporter substrate-binding protein [Clostridiales Family XIII bacterium]